METFIVTLDSGRTWRTWKLPDFQSETGDKCGFFIQDAKLNSRGTGSLRAADGCEGSGNEYQTRDFGISWKDLGF